MPRAAANQKRFNALSPPLARRFSLCFGWPVGSLVFGSFTRPISDNWTLGPIVERSMTRATYRTRLSTKMGLDSNPVTPCSTVWCDADERGFPFEVDPICRVFTRQQIQGFPDLQRAGKGLESGRDPRA